MNRWIVAALCIMVGAAMCQAQGMKGGAYLGYTMAGDVEDNSLAYGGRGA